MLYVFAGFPQKGLNAGGLQYAVENIEELAILEHDPHVQYLKEGLFLTTGTGEEWQEDTGYRISDLCLKDGIT